MSVTFTDASSTPVPEPLRAAYQRVVTEALDLMRPGEYWAVTMDESESVLRLDFMRDTEVPRGISLAADGDDDQHSQLFRTLCRFIWAFWPSDDEQRPL